MSERSARITPDALEPVVPPAGVDEGVFLYRGPAVLRIADGQPAELIGDVDIRLEWRPSAGVWFRFVPRTEHMLVLDLLDHDHLTLTLKDVGASAHCDVFGVRHTFPAQSGRLTFRATRPRFWRAL